MISIVSLQREALRAIENHPEGFDLELARRLLRVLRRISRDDAMFVKPSERVEDEPVGAMLSPAPAKISAYLAGAIVRSEYAPRILSGESKEFLAALDFAGPVTCGDFNWFLNLVTAFLAREDAWRRVDAIRARAEE